jgi:hypothetical protein
LVMASTTASGISFACLVSFLPSGFTSGSSGS